ncbi:hypothetical protein AAG747_25145 [Rapidithrix thailandica]|uniref:Lipid/polyisoprenoid-binding YceI-like domain-containing protein n=1 Tax=Rapidithrix thailandica TaxID=413964 RepID=A0AAW9SE68_9BACT
MIRLQQLWIVGLFLLLFSCKELDKLTQFNMPYEASVTIDSSIGIDVPGNFYSPEIETNSESTFAVNDTRKDLVEEILLTQMSLELKSPEDGDFSFLNEISIYMSAEDLDEIKIAWKENIPAEPGKKIEMEVSNQDLKAYIKKDKFTLRVNSVTDEFITQDHEIDIDANFFVDAKVLGL